MDIDTSCHITSPISTNYQFWSILKDWFQFVTESFLIKDKSKHQKWRAQTNIQKLLKGIFTMDTFHNDLSLKSSTNILYLLTKQCNVWIFKRVGFCCGHCSRYKDTGLANVVIQSHCCTHSEPYCVFATCLSKPFLAKLQALRKLCYVEETSVSKTGYKARFWLTCCQQQTKEDWLTYFAEKIPAVIAISIRSSP